MPLNSRIFSNSTKLNACLVKDADHVKEGHVGEHVKRIQQALKAIDSASILATELTTMRYGPSTANAVLSYKTKRNIVNKTYQSKPDNIVGKMTIDALDKDMLQLQDGPNAPRDLLCKRKCCYPPQYVMPLICPDKFTLNLKNLSAADK